MSEAHPHIPALFLSAATAALFLCGSANAQPAQVPTAAVSDVPSRTAAEQSPFLGMWELDLSRMPSNYGTPPERVTYRFEDVGSGMWLTEVTITAQDQSVRRASVRYRRDGQAVKGEGDNLDGDTAAILSPAPNVLVINIGNGKVLSSVRVYTISADGQEMTESAAGVSNEGLPFVRSFHFRRVR